MNMIRPLENVVDINLTIKETEILAQADEILHRLQLDLGRQLVMQSLETGEIIQSDELPRVRGILGALSEYRTWQLLIK